MGEPQRKRDRQASLLARLAADPDSHVENLLPMWYVFAPGGEGVVPPPNLDTTLWGGAQNTTGYLNMGLHRLQKWNYRSLNICSVQVCHSENDPPTPPVNHNFTNRYLHYMHTEMTDRPLHTYKWMEWLVHVWMWMEKTIFTLCLNVSTDVFSFDDLFTWHEKWTQFYDVFRENVFKLCACESFYMMCLRMGSQAFV